MPKMQSKKKTLEVTVSQAIDAASNALVESPTPPERAEAAAQTFEEHLAWLETPEAARQLLDRTRRSPKIQLGDKLEDARREAEQRVAIADATRHLRDTSAATDGKQKNRDTRLLRVVDLTRKGEQEKIIAGILKIDRATVVRLKQLARKRGLLP